jgi:GNAT superfamily N-acetyltransferase
VHAAQVNGSHYDERSAGLSPEAVLGIDAPQLLAVMALWASWTNERGLDYDEGRVAQYLYNAISGGGWLPIVAYVGDTPVGMVETRVEMDPFTGELTGWGDRAYVLPEYRSAGVFRCLYEGCDFVGKMMGTEAQGLTVSAESGFLLDFYKDRGFREVGWIMRRGGK